MNKALKYANSLRLKAMKTSTWKGSQLNKNRKLFPEDKRVINQVILKEMLTNLNEYAGVGDSYRQTRVAKKR